MVSFKPRLYAKTVDGSEFRSLGSLRSLGRKKVSLNEIFI